MDYLTGLSMLSNVGGINHFWQASAIGGANPENIPQQTNLANGTIGAEETKNSRAEARKYDGFVKEECQTCANRRYQDGSNDSGVSFQTPTKISPEAAASKVRGHEMEHVTRNQAKAQREGREIVSQSVTYQTAICPECGDVYISGGNTRTVTRGKKTYDFGAGLQGNQTGKTLNVSA